MPAALSHRAGDAVKLTLPGAGKKVTAAMRAVRRLIDDYEGSGDSKAYSRALRFIQSDRFYPERGDTTESSDARWFGARAAARWLLLEAMQRRRDWRNAELARLGAEIRAARKHEPWRVM